MARIFVSYSRKNKDFCRQLTDELKTRDLDFWVDWEGIPPTVEWMKEIEKGIEEADTFIAVVSNDWIASPVCIEELNIAVKNGKRLIPVVPYDIVWNDVPADLAKLNFIFFTENFDFTQQLDKLFTALDTDYDWLKTHRRLQVKALEWERANKENGFLLHGRDLDEAEQQISINARKDPNPTDIQREYVLKSRQSATRQRRITTAVLSFIILVLFGITAVVVPPRILNAIARSKARGEMISIPAGPAVFGTDDPTFISAGFPPKQTIQYAAFSIEKYEVTNQQYGLCVKYGDCTVPVDQTDFRDETKKDFPVVNVNLYQANTYCRWLGYRLPTEAEWERAARGAVGNLWPWGDGEPTPERANMPWHDYAPASLEPANSHPLGTSSADVYNMIGNVWEWTSSYAYEGGDYNQAQFWDGDPNTYNGTDIYAQRGGGWLYNIDSISGFNPDQGTNARPDLGIRCAADKK